MVDAVVLDPNIAGGLIGGGLMALIAGAFVMILIVGLALYIYSALVLMAIAKKTNTPNGWLAWIPIANVYLITQISKTPWWTIFGILLPMVPFIGGLAFMALMIYWWWRVSEECKKPGWWGILIGLIPIVNLVMMGILAWGKK